MSFPPQSFFTHSTSFQPSVGVGDWLAIHWESVARLSAPVIRPCRFPKDFRRPARTSAPTGLRSVSTATAGESRGGTVSPFFRSR